MSNRFCRVPLEWVPHLLALGVINRQTAVFLCLCSWVREEGGKPWAGLPRREIAETVGISEKAVSNAIFGLVRKAALKHLRGGKAHTASDYWLVPELDTDESSTKTLGTDDGSTDDALRYWQQYAESTDAASTPKNKNRAEAAPEAPPGPEAPLPPAAAAMLKSFEKQWESEPEREAEAAPEAPPEFKSPRLEYARLHRDEAW